MSDVTPEIHEAEPAPPQEWFCDQCGARYPEDGFCSNQHPPAALKPVTGPDEQPDTADTAAEQTEPWPSAGVNIPPLVTTGQAATVTTVESPAPVNPPVDPVQQALDRLEQAVQDLRKHL